MNTALHAIILGALAVITWFVLAIPSHAACSGPATPAAGASCAGQHCQTLDDPPFAGLTRCYPACANCSASICCAGSFTSKGCFWCVDDVLYTFCCSTLESCGSDEDGNPCCAGPHVFNCNPGGVG